MLVKHKSGTVALIRKKLEESAKARALSLSRPLNLTLRCHQLKKQNLRTDLNAV